ncbi:MAG TPA: sigma-70 family RNA polymerase sigma factor [Pseudonocardiaceae bacterium]|nr:sigma-70 family RNA polymerase sigma factor [Pseudonocardiaceae bacterium]
MTSVARGRDAAPAGAVPTPRADTTIAIGDTDGYTDGETVASDTPLGDHPLGGHVGSGATRRMVGPRGAPTRVAKAEAAEGADDTGGEAWALVQAAQLGDTSAFGQLYDRYVDSVFRYVLFRVGDRTLAEDVTSETFLRAFRRIASISYQGRDVGAWFVTIARNLVLDHVKSSRFKLEIATADPGDGNSVESGPESQVMTQLTHVELLRCVRLLGDDQRECIVLRFLQGLSVSETANVMGRNEGAIKALQHRAVRRLAQLLPAELR